MSETIKPFLCDSVEKSVVRSEWERWFRSFQIYVDAEEITSVVRKRNKLLHLGGQQLQAVADSLPGAVIPYNEKEGNDVYAVLVEKLNGYFTPKRNSAFERHLFRDINPLEGESFNRFVLRLRQQIAKCSFGNTKSEIEEICLKDKIIDVWAPVELKRKLLGKEHTLDEILDACRVDEQINKETQSMIAKPESEVISKIDTQKWRSSSDNNECNRCGRSGHMDNSRDCPARNMKCNKCSRFGHFARKCRTNLKRQSAQSYNFDSKRRRNLVRAVDDETPDDDCKKISSNCFKITSDDECEETVMCQIAGKEISMVIDSGSRFNLLSYTDWRGLQAENVKLFNIRTKSLNKFRAYASEKLLNVICVFEAPIRIKGNTEMIATFYVIENGRQSLLGRETAIKLNVLRLGLNVNRVENIKPFPKWKDVVVKLSIDPAVMPVQQPLRRVPIAVEEKVIQRLEDALRQDIIEPVFGPSSWISPIVVAFKENGDIRLCVDMRRANKAILRENYPLPTFDTFMTKLRGAKYFSRMDLKNAYHQLELHEESREITTFITIRGLFRFKRLLFGVNSAPEIFQRMLEEMLAPCPNAMNYIDDIIIFGSTEEEHDKSVALVRKIFRDNGVCLNEGKCIWKTQKLKFLGHVLSDKGIEVDPEKVQVITSFRYPKNKEEVRSFLGLVTYVGKFIPDLANRTEPLRRLLKKDSKFNWSSVETQAFETLKLLLAEIPSLSYFDPKRKTRLIADASPVALGAVLVQFDQSNEAHIISFASKSLSDVEKRYSQTEKESLSLVWAVEKFYYYLAGLKFELVTDHKPLETIFKPTSKPPARIERWLLRLQGFMFKVIYRAGKENIADSLSRLCQITNTDSFDWKGEQNICHVITNCAPTALSISEIAQNSAQDEEIVDAMSCLNADSWNAALSNSFYPFRFELSTVGSILLRGTRLVIPRLLRSKVLELAHEGHPGESAMKRRLRSKVWWPLMDREAEKFVKACRDCLVVSQPSNPPPMDRHPFPTGPWLTLATDLLGPLPNGQYVLVFIDYYSRYMEFKLIRSISSQAIIDAMREIFCRLGLPKYLKTDNGRQYISTEFKEYCNINGIQQILSPPYWPQANGEVENMNKSLVKRLKIASVNKGSFLEEIRKFVHMYNVTPHSTTGVPPTELMFSRVIRDKLPGIQDLTGEYADCAEKDQDCINKQKGKEIADKRRGAKESDVSVGDKVLLKNVVFPHKLTPNFDTTEYVVTARRGNMVEVSGGGKVFCRNVGHLKKIPVVKLLSSSSSTASSSTDETVSDPSDAKCSSASIGQPSQVAGPVYQQRNITSVKEQTAGQEDLKIRLKNIGGMWQPV